MNKNEMLEIFTKARNYVKYVTEATFNSEHVDYGDPYLIQELDNAIDALDMMFITKTL